MTLRAAEFQTMIDRVALRLKAVGNLSMPVVLARVLGRAGVRGAWLERLDFLNSPDIKRPIKAVEILFDAMRRAGLDSSEIMRRIPGATVLEVGCGRYIGFAALSAVQGAARYIGADPGLKPHLFGHPAVLDRVVVPAISAAAELAGEDVVTPTEMLSLCRLEQKGVAQALKPDDRVDLCVSVSCLEHIGDLDGAMRAIVAASGPDTIHVHLVNFSNHLSKENPFGHLYEMPNDMFASKWKGIVNGMRHTDMTRCFETAGLALDFVPLDIVMPDKLPARIHPFWSDRYDDHVLAVRTGLFFSPAIRRPGTDS